MSFIEDYSHAVVSGDIVAGPHVRASCQRNLRDLRDLDPNEYWFDQDKADFAVRFIEKNLHLVKGEYDGKPFKLLSWARFCTEMIFGWQRNHPRHGPVRRFDSAFILTAKGSSKSLIGMAWGLKCLVADGENRPECYVFARNAKQARVPFNFGVALVQQSDLLNDEITLIGGSDTYKMIYERNDGEMIRMSAESNVSGPMPSFILGDEYHEAISAEIHNSLRSGFKHRKQPLGVLITNAGGGVIDNPCWDENVSSIEVAHGRVKNERHFSYVCGLDDDDDPWEDESCWIKACPSLPDIPGYDDIRRDVNEAIGKPSKKAWVERVRFCRWTDAVNPWIDRDAWLACEVDQLSPEEERAKARCWLALDLAKRVDMTAGATLWEFDDGHWELEATPWIPENRVKDLARLMDAPLDKWIERGWLNTSGKDVMDFDDVAAWIQDRINRFGVLGIGYDAHLIDFLVRDLERLKVPVAKAQQCVLSTVPHGKIPMVAHPQGTQPPSKAKDAIHVNMHKSLESMENAILTGNLYALKNPVLRWAMLGMACTGDEAGNRRPLKLKSKSKIDAAIASVQAGGVAAAWPKQTKPKKFIFGNYAKYAA